MRTHPRTHVCCRSAGRALVYQTRPRSRWGRSLAKERAFARLCCLAGIGMGAFVALVTFNRAITAPARGINTDGLTEVLVLLYCPLRAKAGEWALERWSYRISASREADLGTAITGWARVEPVRCAQRTRRRCSGGRRLRLGDELQHVRRVAGPRTRSRSPSTTRHRPSCLIIEPRLLAEPSGNPDRDRREIPDD